MSQAADIISALKTALDTTASVTTIVDSNSELDMMQYGASDLPLVQIKILNEVPAYNKSSSGHALWRLSLGLTCYFLDDIASTSVRDNLLKQIKDVLGVYSELNGNSVDIAITSEVLAGEFPLWRLEIGIDVTYERVVTNA